MPDVLKVNFQSGQSRSSICIVIIDDDIREGTEKFRLLLSIPYSSRALGVRTQYPYYADVLIIGTYLRLHSYIILLYYVSTYIHTYICMYVCTYICMYVCTYVCMYVHMYVHMFPVHACTHTYAHVCLYVCTYVQVRHAVLGFLSG